MAQKAILYEGVIQTPQGISWETGKGVLTKEQFTFAGKGYAFFRHFGLLGMLANASFPMKVRFALPLSSITTLGRMKQGLNKNLFFIETQDGKKYKFNKNYQEWLNNLIAALQTYAQLKVVQIDKERWEVQR